MPRPNKKAAVNRAAARAFRKHGYHGTSMDMLATDLQLNKGTLYHYYKSKSDLLFDVIMRPLTAVTQSVKEIPETLPVKDQLVELFKCQLLTTIDWDAEVLVYFQERRLLEAILTPEQMASVHREEQVFLQRLTDLLHKGQKTREFRKVDVVVVRAGIVGMVVHAAHWYDPKGRLSLDKVARMFAEFALQGIEDRRTKHE